MMLAASTAACVLASLKLIAHRRAAMTFVRRSRRGESTIIWAVDTTQRLIALTFDDGPVPNCTPLTLDALDEADVPATFFLVGQRLEANASLIDGRMSRHEIGNHTWSHQDLSGLDYGAAYAEIKRSHDAIAAWWGRAPVLFRPPFGKLGTLAMRAIESFDYDVILWNHGVTERSYQDNPEAVIAYVVHNVKPGSIFLAHDAVAPDVEPVFLRRIGVIVKELKADGYEFVTVSDLLTARS
jgi:peptidoglycan/xylan/chitin deacetylase (PgdA/CDA1 family)